MGTDLGRYVGGFQEREFFLRDGRLIYRHRHFGDERELIPLGGHEFLVAGDVTTRLRFRIPSSSGAPDAVVGNYFLGGQDISYRDRPIGSSGFGS